MVCVGLRYGGFVQIEGSIFLYCRYHFEFLKCGCCYGESTDAQLIFEAQNIPLPVQKVCSPRHYYPFFSVVPLLVLSLMAMLSSLADSDPQCSAYVQSSDTRSLFIIVTDGLDDEVSSSSYPLRYRATILQSVHSARHR